MAAASSAGALARVRRIEGNGACIDCGSRDPDWADVLHGSLHCIECAGKHRSLGVQVSFVRSLTMDNWTDDQVVAMLVGGNAQLKSFFRRQRIENSSIDVLYRSKQSLFYREQLDAQVKKTIAKRRAKAAEQQVVVAVKKKAAPTTRRREAAPRDWDVTIHEPKLGASLSRALPPASTAPDRVNGASGNGSMALVTRLNRGGCAERAGLAVGDYVVALNGRPLRDYDEFVALWSRCPRPSLLTIRRFEEHEVDTPEEKDPTPVHATLVTTVVTTERQQRREDTPRPNREKEKRKQKKEKKVKKEKKTTSTESSPPVDDAAAATVEAPPDPPAPPLHLDDAPTLPAAEQQLLDNDSSSSPPAPLLHLDDVAPVTPPAALLLDTDSSSSSSIVVVEDHPPPQQPPACVDDDAQPAQEEEARSSTQDSSAEESCSSSSSEEESSSSEEESSSCSSEEEEALPEPPPRRRITTTQEQRRRQPAKKALVVRRQEKEAEEEAGVVRARVERDGPLGLTLGRSVDDEGVVLRVAPGGLASAAGVREQDVVLRIGQGERLANYDDVLRALKRAQRPLDLALRRNPSSVSSVSTATPTKLLVVSSNDHALRSQDEHDDDIHTKRKGNRTLAEARQPEDDDLEFEVSLEEGALGMRIEERRGLVSVTVVTHVAPGGQAHRLGVRVGCTAVGINGDRYLSHAHTAATLKHGKRPITLRLRSND